MKANGEHLHSIAELIGSGRIRPVVDRILPFESTKEALEYAGKGHVKGKVVIKII